MEENHNDFGFNIKPKPPQNGSAIGITINKVVIRNSAPITQRKDRNVWTTEEKGLLLKTLKKYGLNLISNRIDWKRVCHKFNSKTAQPKTIKELTVKYASLKQTVRQKKSKTFFDQEFLGFTKTVKRKIKENKNKQSKDGQNDAESDSDECVQDYYGQSIGQNCLDKSDRDYMNKNKTDEKQSNVLLHENQKNNDIICLDSYNEMSHKTTSTDLGPSTSLVQCRRTSWSTEQNKILLKVLKNYLENFTEPRVKWKTVCKKFNAKTGLSRTFVDVRRRFTALRVMAQKKCTPTSFSEEVLDLVKRLEQKKKENAKMVKREGENDISDTGKSDDEDDYDKNVMENRFTESHAVDKSNDKKVNTDREHENIEGTICLDTDSDTSIESKVPDLPDLKLVPSSSKGHSRTAWSSEDTELLLKFLLEYGFSKGRQRVNWKLVCDKLNSKTSLSRTVKEVRIKYFNLRNSTYHKKIQTTLYKNVLQFIKQIEQKKKENKKDVRNDIGSDSDESSDNDESAASNYFEESNSGDNIINEMDNKQMHSLNLRKVGNNGHVSSNAVSETKTVSAEPLKQMSSNSETYDSNRSSLDKDEKWLLLRLLMKYGLNRMRNRIDWKTVTHMFNSETGQAKTTKDLIGMFQFFKYWAEHSKIKTPFDRELLQFLERKTSNRYVSEESDNKSDTDRDAIENYHRQREVIQNCSEQSNEHKSKNQAQMHDKNNDTSKEIKIMETSSLKEAKGTHTSWPPEDDDLLLKVLTKYGLKLNNESRIDWLMLSKKFNSKAKNIKTKINLERRFQYLKYWALHHEIKTSVDESILQFIKNYDQKISGNNKKPRKRKKKIYSDSEESDTDEGSNDSHYGTQDNRKNKNNRYDTSKELVRLNVVHEASNKIVKPNLIPIKEKTPSTSKTPSSIWSPEDEQLFVSILRKYGSNLKNSMMDWNMLCEKFNSKAKCTRVKRELYVRFCYLKYWALQREVKTSVDKVILKCLSIRDDETRRDDKRYKKKSYNENDNEDSDSNTDKSDVEENSRHELNDEKVNPQTDEEYTSDKDIICLDSDSESSSSKTQNAKAQSLSKKASDEEVEKEELPSHVSLEDVKKMFGVNICNYSFNKSLIYKTDEPMEADSSSDDDTIVYEMESENTVITIDSD